MVRLAPLLLLLVVACHTPKKVTGGTADTLPATALQPFGRSHITNDGKLELISSAVFFTVRFEDTACDVYTALPAGLHHNYLQYELDGVYQKRLRVSQAPAPLHISAAPGNHTLTFYKATEAQTGALFIQRLTAHNIQAVAPPALPLIEFIGNSITCGAAADPSETSCGSVCTTISTMPIWLMGRV